MEPIRVLLVDDDAADRMTCRHRLGGETGSRFALLEAGDGASGLELARTRHPDCILLDYRLPDLSGLEFLARLAADPDPAVRAIPVLMLTGVDSAAVATDTLRGGARDYLVKDGDGRYLERVDAAIERLLRERRLLESKCRAEARFRTLVEQSGAISYIVEAGSTDRLHYISPQIRMLGYTQEEWLADPALHARCLAPDEREAIVAAIVHSRSNGLPLRVEYRMRARDGTMLWLRDQADMVHDELGRPLFMQGTLIDVTASKQAERRLAESQEALRQLAAHQERVKESERQRIAREIHDELGGLLTGIKAYVSVVAERSRQAGQAVDPLLDAAAGLAQDAMDTVRRVIADLRPSVLDQLGVWAALDWHVSHVAARAGLACSCEIAPSAAGVALDPERGIMLFRIVQEAMTNVLRHAHARSVRLRVDYEDGCILLALEDDGCGIDPGAQGTGAWGILGMRERARSLGGQLRLEARAGGGTTVSLSFPLELHHAA